LEGGWRGVGEWVGKQEVARWVIGVFFRTVRRAAKGEAWRGLTVAVVRRFFNQI